MRRHSGFLSCSPLAAVVLIAAAAPMADAPAALEARDLWSNVFGGKATEFRFTVKAAKDWRGRAVWSLTAENDRVLASGEADVAATADKPGEATVKLPAFEVKAGVVLKTRLLVRLFAAGDKKPLATHDRPIWIFARDPFINRKEWLKGLKIALFDPEKTTADPLKKLEVPFDEINSVAALGAVKEGLLLVGEGVSFKDFPDLAETLTKAAAAGLPVLCLAPSGGSMPVPGTSAKGPRPRAVLWRRADHITILDKRLDATAWPPEGKVMASTLALKAEDGAVVAEVGKDAGDWAWLEAEFPAKTGRLIVCGFGLAGKPWEAGPAPRYLFARLLEVLAGKTEDRDTPDKEPKR